MAKLLMVVGFLIAFGAGMVVGPRVLNPASALPATRPSGHNGWLTTELNLNPEQQEQLKRIWSDTAHRGNHEQEDRRRQYRRERDEAIAALIHPEDKGDYDQILKTYSEKVGEMEREWRTSFQASVEKTKQILTPAQRARYEELLKRGGAGGPPGPGPGPGPGPHGEHDQNRRVDEHATSRPGTDKP
jgi:Spy/CpxP family protein refolding chaperone